MHTTPGKLYTTWTTRMSVCSTSPADIGDFVRSVSTGEGNTESGDVNSVTVSIKMSENSERCSSQTEGLILSSFQVLQDSRAQHDEVRQHLKLSCSFLNDTHVVDTDQNQAAPSGHVCVSEAAEGDEMFDVADSDHYRGDEVGDSLDNTTSNSIDREEEGEDEEEDEDDEDEDGVTIRRDRLQRISRTKANVAAEASVGALACAPTVTDLRSHHCQQADFEELTPELASHGFIDTTQAVWHADSGTASAGGRYQADWHMTLSSASAVATREVLDNGVLSAALSPEDDSRERDAGDQHWKFVRGHGSGSNQHLWAGGEGAAKVVVAAAGPVTQSWVSQKQDVHHHVSMDSSSTHWNPHPQVHGWPKDIGSVITPEEDMNAVRSLFNLQAASNGISAPAVSNSYSDLACANSGAWNMNSHIPSGSSMGTLPQPILHHDLTCPRAAPPAFYHQGPAQSYTGFQGQGREGWQQAGLTVDGAGEHYKMADVQSSMVCKSAILNKRTKARTSKCRLSVPSSGLPSKSRSALDQARHQAHPYQMKEQKKVVRDVYPATSANVHTLKASHIVSWYIDYLIHENEHLTQISRAFSLPVNLFLSDDFYFMDSLKKKVHFPSLKFLSWMQQNLPSINVNAIDFHEGRPPVVSTWNQDWFWQNKSRRDIIHDVFFYFQHRRVTCET